MESRSSYITKKEGGYGFIVVDFYRRLQGYVELVVLCRMISSKG